MSRRWLLPIALAGLSLAFGRANAVEVGVGPSGEPIAPPSAPVAPGPCRHVPGGVFCEQPGFDRIVGRCVGFERDGELCRVRLEAVERKLTAAEAARADAEKRLTECLSRPVVHAVPPTPAGTWRAPTAYLLGAVGAASLIGTAALPVDWQGKLTLGAVGLVGLGAGLWVATFE